MSGESKELRLYDAETGVTYRLLLNASDCDRAEQDYEFASGLLFHSRATNAALQNVPVNQKKDIETEVSNQEHNENEVVKIDENEVTESNKVSSQQINHKEVTNESSFSPEATKLFLELWENKKLALRNPNIKRRTIFEEITANMRHHNYDFRPTDIERKFRNMKQYYLNIKDNNRRTGRDRKAWPYYDCVDRILAKDKSIKPCSLVGSMKFPQTSNQQSNLTGNSYEAVAGPSHKEQVNPPSAFDLVSSCCPNTEMLPETASTGDVTQAVKKRRLQKTAPNNPHIKKIRKKTSYGVHQEMLECEKKRNDEIVEIKRAIEEHNVIQAKRNDLLQELINKL